jgi:hypothetical protein
MINKIIVIVPVIAIILGMMTATLTIPVKATPSGCPDPGQCTCDVRSGVMTDHAMIDPNNPGQLLPGASINNGCDGTGN